MKTRKTKKFMEVFRNSRVIEDEIYDENSNGYCIMMIPECISNGFRTKDSLVPVPEFYAKKLLDENLVRVNENDLLVGDFYYDINIGGVHNERLLEKISRQSTVWIKKT